MTLQSLVVLLLVAASAAAAVWQLMPSSLRAQVAARLARAPLPRGLRSYFAAAGQSTGCSGCGGGCKPAQAVAQPKPLVFHPRRLDRH